ncbi:MAG: EAL domain-containing protein, partial [Pseudomonadota bacterium]|nr:EAL domain-containing protein [Pseudomonadota bacterium]
MNDIVSKAQFVIDATDRIVSWPQSCSGISGFSATDAIGQRLDRFIMFDARANAGSASFAADWRHRDAFLLCRDGSRLPVMLATTRQYDQGHRLQSQTVTISTHDQLDALTLDRSYTVSLAALVDTLPCMFFVISEDGCLKFWNQRLLQLSGWSSDELESITASALFAQRDRIAVEQKVRQAFETGDGGIEASMLCASSKTIACVFNFARMHFMADPCVFAVALDISARKDLEMRLAVRERAMNASVNAIAITRCSGSENPIEYVNPAFERITGYSLQESIGRDPRFMQAGTLDSQERQRIRAELAHRHSVRSVIRNTKKNGEIFWNDLRIDPVTNADGEVTHFVAVISDVTEAKHRERELQHLARHDALTGLANRMLLQDRLEQAIIAAQRKHSSVAVAFLDVDHFKGINDGFGHAAGDLVLKEVAWRLRQCVRESDTVARLGGDEFVVLLCDQAGIEHVTEMVERMRLRIAEPMLVAEQELTLGISIGVSLYPQDGESAERLMQSADAAMYHAKTVGRNNCQFYSIGLNRTVQAQLILKTSLGQAIERSELFLLFQPKVDLRTSRMIGAEALVRWRHPHHGVMLPDRFIAVAEETGLIVPMGAWILDAACLALRQIRASGHPDFTIAVNLSARQLRHRSFVGQLAQRLEDSGIGRGGLELEVTESQLFDDPTQAVATLHQLKSLGVQLSIDDFGTGYSSLSYLQKFPVDSIKIDKSFVQDVGLDTADTIIIKAIISLGHSLN